MTRATHRAATLVACLTSAVLGVGVIASQQPQAAGGFTAAQATAGRQIFDANCASCHRQDLGGSNEAPPLAGVNFVNTWGARSVDLLTTYIQTAMPPSGPRLSTTDTLSVTAYVLQANGGQPGAQPLSDTTKASIATLVTAQGQATPAGPAAAPAPDGPISGVRGGAANLPPGRGLTVSGEVRNYTPVTDAMLRNPPDGDWLLWPAAAHAQATLAGVVRDNTGAVLPGVTIEAASAALIEKSRTAISDGNGQYRITELPPGIYTLTFTLSGFTVVRREDVEVRGSGVIAINADLRIGALQETITVTGESPLVDTQTTRREMVLTSDTINSLPATRSYGALLNAIPGLSTNTGSTSAMATPDMTFFTANGGRQNGGQVQIEQSPRGDIAYPIGAFSQAFMGSPSTSELAQHGLIEVRNPDAVKAAEQLFTPMPVCCMEFF